MRITVAVFTSVLVCGFAMVATVSSAAVDERSETSSTSQDGLQIEIQSPSDQFVAANGERTIEVEGVASRIGGVRYLDMIFVMDTSTSLRSTDPKDFRSVGAVGLVGR